MRTSPSIVPHGPDKDDFLVLDDFGWIGCCWRETEQGSTDRETLIRALVEGELTSRSACWSRDVSEDIACELASLLARDDCDIPSIF
jgi:hypothetical protein